MSVTAVEDAVRRWVQALDAPPRHLLVAVSGGGDSLALLFALKSVSQHFGMSISAATVDHGLRPAATEEAAYVASLCRDAAIPHCILNVEWSPDETPGQSRARGHRYALLAHHAKSIGAEMVATGHTNDDQAETILMRANSGSGWWGLSAMTGLSAYPVWPQGEGLLLARPVLSVSRTALREYLTEQDIQWIDDPSNEDVAYERVRVRQYLAGNSELKQSVLASGTHFGQLRTENAETILNWAEHHLAWLPGGAVQVSRQALPQLTAEQRFRLFQHLLPCISGHSVMPRAEPLQSLLGEIIFTEQDLSRTLSGCVISKRADILTLGAELKFSGVQYPLANGSIWNGRVILTCPEAEVAGLFVTAWDEKPVPKALNMAQNLPFFVRKALPVVVNDKGDLVSVPHFEPQNGILAIDLARSRLRNWLNAKTVQFREESHTEESFSR